METLDHIGPVLIALPLFGLLAMIGVPNEWQNVQGWLIISFLGIPGFLVVIALMVNMPVLLFGTLFFLGIFAARK